MFYTCCQQQLQPPWLGAESTETWQITMIHWAAAASQRMKEWMKIGQHQERQRKEREVISVSPPHQKS